MQKSEWAPISKFKSSTTAAGYFPEVCEYEHGEGPGGRRLNYQGSRSVTDRVFQIACLLSAQVQHSADTVEMLSGKTGEDQVATVHIGTNHK